MGSNYLLLICKRFPSASPPKIISTQIHSDVPPESLLPAATLSFLHTPLKIKHNQQSAAIYCLFFIALS